MSIRSLGILAETGQLITPRYFGELLETAVGDQPAAASLNAIFRHHHEVKVQR